MSDENLFAGFEPTEPALLSTAPQGLLLVENPLLASALSNIFPYLLFIDNFLSIITWTNEDPCLNFLIVTAYSVLVIYWKSLKHWVLPPLLVLCFTSVVWTTTSIWHDAKFGEKPTIDEILSAMNNITVRFELILRPAKQLDMSWRNHLKMVVGVVLLTPAHLSILKFLCSPQTLLWTIGVAALTYHSPFAFATRRLLWRSAYARWAMYYLTGLNIRLTRNEYMSPTSRAHETISRTHSQVTSDTEEEYSYKPTLDSVHAASNFTVLKTTVVSSTQLKQIIRYDILENERRWLGLGWSKYMLPNERAGFCYDKSMMAAPDPCSEKDFEFPVYDNDLYSYQWQWMDDKWSIDLDFNRSKYEKGWVYFDKNWSESRYEDGFSRYTRTRKWTRRAVLLIDKRAEVYDEQG